MGLTRAIAAAAALTFSLPVTAGWNPGVPVALRIAAVCVLTISLYRPVWGLLTIAGLLPLTMLISALAETPFGAVETGELLMVPVTLACAIRVLTARRPAAAGLLFWPAVAMGAIVATALAVQLATYRDPDVPFATWAAGFWRHLSWTYYVDGALYPPLHRALMWIAALGLAVSAERFLRDDLAALASVTRMAVFGAAGAGLFALVRVAEIALRSLDGSTAVWHALVSLRISPHTDPNAAGSFYVMVVVPSMYWAASTRRWWSAVALPPLLGALWLTRSRTALIACVVAIAVTWMLSRRWSWRRFAAAGLAGAVILAALVAVGFGRAQSAEPAMRFRADMAQVSFRLAARNPLFGLGLDEFHPASVSVITPEAISRFPPAARGENAHNNFLQILVELGAIGLVTFIWLLTRPTLAFARALREGRATPWGIGLAGGLLAFVLTCLAGHPLMVPQIAPAFFLVLGLFAASVPSPASDRADRRSRLLGAVALALLGAALAYRLAITI